MSNTDKKRQPLGQPTGGEFAQHKRSDAGLSLGTPRPGANQGQVERSTMSTMRNHNYRIETETLPDGRVLTKARGRKTNAHTYPAGTDPEVAADDLARRIEGLRFAEVRNLTAIAAAGKAEWAIYVTTG